MSDRDHRAPGDGKLRRGPSLLAALAVASCFAALATPLVAQNPNYILEMPDLIGPPGTDVIAILTLDNSAGSPVSGVSIGVCSDPALVLAVTVQEGAAAAALNGGAGPAFFDISIAPEGFGFAMLTAFGPGAAFLPALDHQIAEVRYSLSGPSGAVSALDICDTLIFPPVTNPLATTVIAAGSIITPAQVDGSIEIAPIPAVTFAIDASALAIPGGSVAATVLLGNTEPIFGFSFGLTFPQSELALNSAVPTGLLAQTQGGGGPHFFLADLAPAGGNGATIQCTIGMPPSPEALPIGVDQPIIALDFAVAPTAGPPCAILPVGFTDTLGAPPVPIEVTLSPGTAAPATTIPGGIVLGPAPPPAPPAGGITLLVDQQVAAAGQVALSRVTLDSDAAIRAFSFGISYLPGDVTLLTVEPGLHVAQLRCGQGPEFFAAAIHGGATPGATAAAVFAIQPPLTDETIGPGGGLELVLLEFATSANPASGGSPLQFTDALGSPPVAIEVTVGSQAVLPATVDGGIALISIFTRGDANGDGGVDIADAIRLLAALFPGAGSGAPLDCFDASDANDDGHLDVADAITILSALFGGAGGGIQPPLDCGSDPSGDAIGCDLYTACP